MSIWGKIIGGVAGFAIGGPLGGIIGTAFGHAIDRSTSKHRAGGEFASVQTRQTAFTVGVIVLSAKMAKADGKVTREEIDTFKKIFNIPSDELREVGRLFDEAKRDADGYEPYARQIADLFVHDPAVLENLLGGLFQIALADGVIHRDELNFLKNVSREFRFNDNTFERIRAVYDGAEQVNPYEVLGGRRDSTEQEVKQAYRKLIKEHHPDTLIAQGMPQEFVDMANKKVAQINAAYEKIENYRASSGG